MWGLPGYTTCTVGTSISTIPLFRHTSSTALLQSTLSSPMQHPSDAMGRDNNVPITRGPVIPTFLQHGSGLPGQNMNAALRGNTTLRVMGGHCVTTTIRILRAKLSITCRTTRDSTVPPMTGNSHGNPVTQGTSGTPDHSSNATGGSPMEF